MPRLISTAASGRRMNWATVASTIVLLLTAMVLKFSGCRLIPNTSIKITVIQGTTMSTRKEINWHYLQSSCIEWRARAI
jgi:hypothetical protein